MAQPEPQERSFRVRKDAKIALVVILALMVMVVVIWGRSPRPEDRAGLNVPAAEEPKDAGTVASDLAATDATADPPKGQPSLFPPDPAMMNHLDPINKATVRHNAGAPPAEDRVALRNDDARDAVADTGTPPTDAVKPAPKPENAAATTHVVAKGDTYTKIAAKYYKDGGKWAIIQKANGGKPVLQIGQKLVIPPLPGAPAKPAAEGTHVETPAPAKPSADKPAPGTPSKPAPAPRSTSTYTVKKGDTFRSIARSVYRDSAKWDKLYQANRAKLPNPSKPDSLRPGTVIQVPALASAR